jgi:T-complex protein 1 subunit beta
MAGNNPTQIFANDVVEEKGENARLSAFVGAIAVGDLVKSTLGPKGMDKILQSAYVCCCLGAMKVLSY